MTSSAQIAFNTTSPVAAARPAEPISAARAEERAALEKAAKGFEAIFVRQLLGSMRKASMGEGIDSSSAVEQFQDMSDANMANSLADGGGLGIAQMILQQLDRR